MEYQTKKQVAIERLRHAIRAGLYEPGEPLRQNVIASDLGLSSTPVREALAELSVSGLVVYEQHRGARVPTLNLEQIEDIYAARRLIEKEAAKLSFKNLTQDDIATLASFHERMEALLAQSQYEELMVVDEQFHQRLVSACGNPYIVSAVEHLMKSFPRYFMWNLGGRLQQSMREHGEIVKALRKKDRLRFLTAITDHLDHSLDAVREHFESELRGTND